MRVGCGALGRGAACGQAVGCAVSASRGALLEDHEWLRARRDDGLVGGADQCRGWASLGSVGRRWPLPGFRRSCPRPGPAFRELYDRGWMREQLAQRTVTEVARMLGCSTRSAKEAARRAGIPGRRRAASSCAARRRVTGWRASWQRPQLRADRRRARLFGQGGRAGGAGAPAADARPPPRRRFPQLYDADWLRRARATKTPRPSGPPQKFSREPGGRSWRASVHAVMSLR